MSLRVWLPLNGDLRNNGLSDIDIIDSNLTVDNNGKIGKCYSFNGSSSKITNTFNTSVSSSIGSLACWVKFNAFPASNKWYTLLQLGNLGGYATCRLGLYMEYTNKISVSIDGSSSQNLYTHSLLTNQWYHICATYNGSIVKLYIDGIEVMSNTATKGSYTAGASYLFMGATNNFWLNGYMNDARYYDHALSAKEVKEISKGLVCHYKLDNDTKGGQENLFRATSMTTEERANSDFVSNGSTDWTKYFRFYNGSTNNHTFNGNIDTILLNSASNLGIAFQRKATDINLDSSSYYTISCEAKCTKENAHLDIGLSYYTTSDTWVWRGGSNAQNFNAIDTWQKFKLKFKPDSNTQYIMYCFTVIGVSGGTDTFSIRNCKLEKGEKVTQWLPNKEDIDYNKMGYNSNIVYDSSGYNNHAEKYAYDATGAIEVSSNTPRNSLSTYVNSENNTTNTASGTVFLYGNCGLVTPNYLTVAFWCKPIAGYATQAGQGQFCTTIGDIGMHAGSDYSTTAMHNRDSYIDMCTSTSVHKTVNIAFTANEWHHYAIIYDGRYGRVYKDGVKTSTLDMGSNLSLASFTAIVIGYSNAGGVYRSNKSYYSDFRVYSTALSEEDIKELYNTPISISNNGSIFTQGEYVEV